MNYKEVYIIKIAATERTPEALTPYYINGNYKDKTPRHLANDNEHRSYLKKYHKEYRSNHYEMENSFHKILFEQDSKFKEYADLSNKHGTNSPEYINFMKKSNEQAEITSKKHDAHIDKFFKRNEEILHTHKKNLNNEVEAHKAKLHKAELDSIIESRNYRKDREAQYLKEVKEFKHKPVIKAIPNSVEHIPLPSTPKPKFGRLAAAGVATGVAVGGLAAYHYMNKKKKK